MNPQIRKIDPDDSQDVKQINQIGVYAFHPSPSREDLQKRLDNAPYRSESDQFLLSVEGQPLAAASIHPLSQHVREKIIEVGGVATVGTLPHARRKGYVSQLMRHLLSHMMENGQVLSVLHPFRESFYDRFGYATLPDRQEVQIQATSLRQIYTLTSLTPRLSHHHLKEMLDRVEQFLMVMQLDLPGMVRFTSKKFREIEQEEEWVVFAQDDSGRDTGLLVYSISEYGGTMEISHMQFKTTDARYQLLHFMANHIDHVQTITCKLRRDQNIERWLPDLDVSRSFKDGAMVRVVDVSQLGLLELTCGRDQVSIVIKDDQCPWNEGTYRIDGRSGVLKVEKIDEECSDWIDIRVLSSLVYGFYNLKEAAIKGWINLSDQVRSKLEHIFPPDPHEVILYF